MQILKQDIRLAFRQLARNPGFTFTALATLALAIGATTAVFSLVDGVLLSPLGYPQPDRLVYVEATSPKGQLMPVSPQDLSDFESQTHSFTGMAAVDPGESVTLTRSSAAAERLEAARVGGTFFDVLGVRPQVGHYFGAGSDARNAAKIVVLSDALWRRDFGGDPRIVGRRITLDGAPREVVAVAPPEFTFPQHPDAWYPAVWATWEIGDNARGDHSVRAIARLAPGATLESARRDLGSVAARIAHAFPKLDARVGATAVSLRDQIVGDTERPLWILFGAVAFVLLIACANIGNLMLVRATARESEIAVRTALGAGRGRLMRQFVTESTLLAVAGAILGTMLAAWAIAALIRFGPGDLPRIDEIAINGRVLAFSAGVAVLAGIGFGLLPAMHLLRPDLANMLRSGSRGLASGASRTRSVLVIAELALGTVLLVGAGLLIRSFQGLVRVNPGFQADHVIVFDAALSGAQYAYDAATNAFTDAVRARLAALPGTDAAAVAANRPFDADPGFEASTSFQVDGQPKPAPGSQPESRILPVSPSFFEAMGMTLVRGRTFTADDDRIDTAPVVVVDQALADRYFPGEDPIGKHLTFGISHNVTAAPGDTLRARGEIIGIVRSVQLDSLSGTPEPAAYLPYRTLPAGPAFIVRTHADPAVVEREIRAQVAAVDRDVPIYELQTLRDALGTSVARPRFYMVVCSAFAAVALILAALGIYGVISYGVVQRTREFGIRIALGSTTADVVRLVVRRGAWLTIAGLAVGIAGAVVATRAMTGLLFGVQPLDAATFAVVLVVLGGAATFAAWLPARRAAAVDPVIAMRAE